MHPQPFMIRRVALQQSSPHPNPVLYCCLVRDSWGSCDYERPDSVKFLHPPHFHDGEYGCLRRGTLRMGRSSARQALLACCGFCRLFRGTNFLGHRADCESSDTCFILRYVVIRGFPNIYAEQRLGRSAPLRGAARPLKKRTYSFCSDR